MITHARAAHNKMPWAANHPQRHINELSVSRAFKVRASQTDLT